MPLHPQAQAVYDRLRELGNPTIADLGLAQARAGLAGWNRLIGDGPAMAAEEDVDDPVPMRVYRPRADGDLPVVLWMHGGGWALGSVDEHNGFCRHLAAASGCAVVSVDYRLAPEHPFPAGLDDCWAALQWAAQQPGGDRLAVAGDSAGGNLAAVLALRARDEGGPPLRFQLLVYPGVDALRSFPSIRENGEGYFLYAADIEWFDRAYLGDHDPKDPYVSPLYADDLSGLPPAYVVTTAYDPLRDEGEAYAQRLADAGVPVEVRRYDGQLHAFFTMPGFFDDATDAVRDAGAALAAALAAGTAE